MFKDLVNKDFIDEILSVINVYGPLDKEGIEDYLVEYYSHSLNEYEKEEMDLYLESLIAINRLYEFNNMYSSLTQDALKHANKELREYIIIIGKTEKKYSKEELIKYANVDKLYGIKEFDKLKKYYDSLVFKNKAIKEELFLALCFGIYSCFDINNVIDELDKSTNNLNRDKLNKYLTDYSAILPRPFLHGFTYLDLNNIEEKFEEFNELMNDEEMLNEKIDDYFSDKYKIQEKINKKQYGEFSYNDCLQLIRKVDKSEIYKLVDSDKVLELLINDIPVYVAILGYYRNDKAILIFRSKEEMNFTHYLMTDESAVEYPNLTRHVSCIEVSNEGIDFLTDEMINDLNKKKIPLEPNIAVLNGYKGLRFPNQEELNLVGSVLSDIIKLMQLSNLSEIKLNLGETVEMFDIYQVYVGDEEVLYGRYNNIEKGDITLDFKLNKVNKKIVNNLKKHKKRDILIGTYIIDAFMEDAQEFPHMVMIIDKETEFIYHGFLKSSKDLKDIKNEVLKVLDELKIRPKCIYVNNDYCYEIFDEYEEYYELDYDEDGVLDGIYNMFLEDRDIIHDEDDIIKS